MSLLRHRGFSLGVTGDIVDGFVCKIGTVLTVLF